MHLPLSQYAYLLTSTYVAFYSSTAAHAVEPPRSSVSVRVYLPLLSCHIIWHFTAAVLLLLYLHLYLYKAL